MYKTEGIFLFAHGKNGELYQKQLNIVDLAITFPDYSQRLKSWGSQNLMEIISIQTCFA